MHIKRIFIKKYSWKDRQEAFGNDLTKITQPTLSVELYLNSLIICWLIKETKFEEYLCSGKIVEQGNKAKLAQIDSKIFTRTSPPCWWPCWRSPEARPVWPRCFWPKFRPTDWSRRRCGEARTARRSWTEGNNKSRWFEYLSANLEHQVLIQE